METNLLCFNIENASKALIPFTKNYWKDRNKQIKYVLSLLSPDIMCFNEATNLQINDLDNKFCDKLGYERYGEYTFYPILLSDCNPIYVKKSRFTVISSGSFCLSNTPSKRYSKLKVSEYYRNCNWVKVVDKYDDSNCFYVFATHTNGNEQGEMQQKILVEEIEKIIGPNDKAIVCGDFNLFYDSGKLKTMSDHFDNAREIMGIDENPTYHDRFERDVRCAIDFFFTRNVNPTNYRIVKESGDITYLSDHYPILLKF